MSHIKVELSLIKNIMVEIYNYTYIDDLDIALSTIQSLYLPTSLHKNIVFLKKMIEYEASGMVIPPVNFHTFYKQVVKEIEGVS